MRKTKRSLLALLLALALGLTMGLTAFADDSEDVVYGTYENPAEAAITKILQLPQGTTTPNADFLFDVAPVSANGENDTPTFAAMPVIGDDGVVTISYSASDTADPVDGVITLTKESPSLFQGSLFDGPWPGTGVFVYEVTERDDEGFTPVTPPPTEVMTYSQASYLLNVYVKQDPETGNLFVYAISALRVTEDNGTDAGYKVDPTPGIEGTEHVYSEMSFTNSFVRINGDDEVDGSKHLTIAKAVNGDWANTDEFFNFTLSITPPSLLPSDLAQDSYPAEIYNADGTHVGTISVEPGTAAEFSLKHGWRLVVLELPVGTDYAVEEIEPTNYEPSYSLYIGGGTPDTVIGNLGEDLEAVGYVADAGVNRAAFTNLRDDITPTGLNLNMLPFVIMVLMAAGAIVSLAAVKARKKNRSH